LAEEELRSQLGCDNACAFELGAVGSNMFRGMVMADVAKIARAVDLVVSISLAITTGHPGVVNSIAVIKGFF
jgi:hypothetical protein